MHQITSKNQAENISVIFKSPKPHENVAQGLVAAP
jgi:hypothetical protein